MKITQLPSVLRLDHYSPHGYRLLNFTNIISHQNYYSGSPSRNLFQILLYGDKLKISQILNPYSKF